MAETIDNIISEKAFEQIQRLLEELTKLDEKMVSAIDRVENYRTALQNASGFKDTASGINNLQKSVQGLNKTNSERLNIEREIKAEGEKAAKIVTNEVNAWQEVQKVLNKVTISFGELSSRVVYNQYKLDRNREAQKQLKDEIKKAHKDLQDGLISRDRYNQILDKNNDKILDLTISEAKYREIISESKMDLKVLTKEQMNAESSMDQMNAQLGYLRDTYRKLSQEERDNIAIGGELRKAINQLDDALKMHDKSIGNNQRNVGNYDIANKNLRTVLMEVKQDLALQKIEYENTGKAIMDQERLVSELARTKGVESAEYKNAVQELNKLKDAYKTAGAAISDLEKYGGQLQGVFDKTGQSMKALANPAANAKAVSDGVGLMMNSYTLFQSSMVALGVESEGLLETFAKLQIMQQGLNAITQITNSLQSESVLRLKLKALWQKVVLVFTKEKAAAQTKETATTVASTVADKAQNVELTKQAAATTTATATTTGLAAAEGVATKTSWTLVGALKAVGRAIKSIPVVGWVLAAIAALSTLTALVYKHLTAEKELTEEQRKRKHVAQQLNEIQTKTTEQTKEKVTKVTLLVKELDKVKTGSNEWNRITKEISKETGLNLDNIKKSKKAVKDVTDEWIKQYMIRAKAEQTINQVVQSELDFMNLKNEVLTASAKERKETIAKLPLSKEEKDELLNYLNILKGSKEGEYKNTNAWNWVQKLIKKAEDNLSSYNDKLLETINIQDLLTGDDGDDGYDGYDGYDKAAASLITMLDIEQKRAEMMEDGVAKEQELLKVKLQQLEKERIEKVEAAKKEGQDIKLINEYYRLEKEKAETESKKKISDIETAKSEALKKINNDLFDVLMQLEEQRLQDGTLTSEQLTDKLIEIEERKKNEILSRNEDAMRKELEVLKEGSEEYLAIVKKYEALNQLVIEQSTQKQGETRKKGWDALFDDLNKKFTNKELDLIIEKGRSLSPIEESKLKIEQINEEIAALDKLAEGYEQGTDEYARYVNLRKLLMVDLIKEEENYKAAVSDEISEVNNLVGALTGLGSAMADNIQDEERRIKVKQRLTMVEVALTKALAIAQVLIDKGDPYTKAIRIAANLAAVITGFVQAQAAINQAKAYEHGTNYHTGGYAVVGEGKKGNEYKPEIVFAGGKKYLFDQPTFLKDLPVGAQVKPLEDWINSNSFDFYQTPMDKETASQIIGLLSEIKNKPIVNIDVGQNIYSHIIRGANRTRILNQRFRA